jgi:hypothetical protein
MDLEIEMTKPRCPACQTDDAMTAGVCRVCKFDIHAEVATAPNLDMFDPKDPRCRCCGEQKILDENGDCESCFMAQRPSELALACDALGAQLASQGEAPHYVPLADRMAQRQHIPVVRETPSTVGGALNDIAQSSQANHFDANAVANGRASLGVGFSVAEGYVESLRRGVARTTFTEYTNTLRRKYGYKVEETTNAEGYHLTLTKDGTSESFAADFMVVISGGGYDGETVTDASVQNKAALAEMKQRTAARKARQAGEAATKKLEDAANAAKAAETKAESLQKIAGQELVSVAGATAVGALFGFRAKGDGSGSMTRKALTELWAKTGAPAEWLPELKSARAQAGRACNVLRRVGVQVFPEKKGERLEQDKAAGIESDYDHRWFVGTISRLAKIGEKLGDTELIVTLRNDKLEFEGNADMAKKVADEFKLRTDEELYTAGDIRDWLESTVFLQHLDAVGYGGNVYVPRQNREQAKRITLTFSGSGWGERWVGSERHPELPLTSFPELAMGLRSGLEDEVNRHLEEMEKQREDMRSSKTGDIGKVAASNYLTRLREVGKRIHAYSALLGEDYTDGLWKSVRDAMAEVEGIIDDPIIERFALIREEIEADRERARGVYAMPTTNEKE